MREQATTTETAHRGFTIFLRGDFYFSVRHPDPDQNAFVQHIATGSLKDAKEKIDDVIADQEKAKRLQSRFSLSVLTSNGDEIQLRGIHAKTGEPLMTVPDGVSVPDFEFFGPASWVAGLLAYRAELKKQIAQLTATLEPAKVKIHFSRYGTGARQMEELAAAIAKATQAAIDGESKAKLAATVS